MSTICTRLATAFDVDNVAALFDAYRQFYGQKSDLPLAIRYISDKIDKNGSVIILAEDRNQRILGFCQLYPTFCSIEAAPIFILYDLFVAPPDRKSGTGKLLLLAAEAHARRNNIIRMDLTTAKNNLQAQSLYNSMGWVRDDEFYTYSKHIGP